MGTGVGEAAAVKGASEAAGAGAAKGASEALGAAALGETAGIGALGTGAGVLGTGVAADGALLGLGALSGAETAAGLGAFGSAGFGAAEAAAASGIGALGTGAGVLGTGVTGAGELGLATGLNAGVGSFAPGVAGAPYATGSTNFLADVLKPGAKDLISPAVRLASGLTGNAAGSKGTSQQLPKIPDPVRMPDPNDKQAIVARKRQLASGKKSGKPSTILTNDPLYSDKLGA